MSLLTGHGQLSGGSSESTHITLHIYRIQTTAALRFVKIFLCHSSVALNDITIITLSSLRSFTKKTLQAAAYRLCFRPGVSKAKF